jgi:anti-sigma regulatory factor (Ser/Thr protein kinase)
VNIASYAYQDGPGRLAVEWINEPEEGQVIITFEDSGVPFNPLLKEEPDLTVPVSERKIGGLGIMMVRKRMDTVNYAYSDGKNILTLIKRVNP